MIALPPAHPVCFRMFSVILGVLCLFLIGVIAAFVGLRHPWSLALGLAALATLPGLLRPNSMCWAYRVWNRLAIEFARYASMVVMAVLFYVVLVAVGRSGSCLGLARPVSRESLWMPRQSLPPHAYKSEYWHASNVPSKAEILGMGRFWVRFLWPFILLLEALGDTEEQQVPTEIYTLF